MAVFTTTENPNPASGTAPLRLRLGAAALIALAVIVGHGLSLWGGFAFDDHLHRLALREAGWSWTEIMQAARVGDTQGMIRFWWGDQPTLWQPFRPLCFLLMKIEYMCVGWRPVGMHAFCLLWHVACALLVRALALRFLGNPRWSLFAAMLFALHPGHGTTSEWIAGTNEIMAGTFVLGSLLAYGRFARWPAGMIFTDPSSRHEADMHRGGAVFLGVALIAYAAALGCRENAVVVPVLALVFDLLAGRLHRRRHMVAYACFVGLTLGYLWLRARALGGMPAPGLPYMYPPSEPGFVRFVLDKLLFYQLGVYLFVPCLQLGPFEFFQQHAWFLYLLSAGTLAGLAALIARVLGSSRFAWGLFAWTVICVGPVLPVFAGSHHLYLPSVGGSILFAAGVMHLGRLGRSVFGSRVRVPLVGVMVLAYALGSLYTGVQFGRLARTEQSLARSLSQTVGTARDGDRVFVLDFPPLGCFIAPAVAEATGARDLAVYALSVRAGGGPGARFKPEDERRVRLWVPPRTHPVPRHNNQAGYFGAMAERQIESLIPAAAGPDELPAPGTIRSCGEFNARLIDLREDGWSEWLLEFDEVLSSSRYHFCVALPGGAFEPMVMSPLPAGPHDPAAQRFTPADG